MGGTRGHFPTGSNVTRPFSNWIKMALLVFASQQGNMHMGGDGHPGTHARTIQSFRTNQHVLKPPDTVTNCSGSRACHLPHQVSDDPLGYFSID